MKGNTGKIPSKRRLINDVAVVSNQWQSNPRQQRFLYQYFEPTSNTFGNVFKSAIVAGYSESYARTLTRSSNKNMWLSEYLSQNTLLPEHIKAGITNIALDQNIKPSDRLKAYELIGKLEGLFVDKSITLNGNIEDAINMLK